MPQALVVGLVASASNPPVSVPRRQKKLPEAASVSVDRLMIQCVQDTDCRPQKCSQVTILPDALVHGFLHTSSFFCRFFSLPHFQSRRRSRVSGFLFPTAILLHTIALSPVFPCVASCLIKDASGVLAPDRAAASAAC